MMSLAPDESAVKSAPPTLWVRSRSVNERGLKTGNDSTPDPETEQPAHMRMKHSFDHYLRGKKTFPSFNFSPSYLEPEAWALPGR